MVQGTAVCGRQVSTCMAISLLVTGKIFFITGISLFISINYVWYDDDDLSTNLAIAGGVFTGVGLLVTVIGLVIYCKIRNTRVRIPVQPVYNYPPGSVYPSTAGGAVIYPSSTTYVAYPGQTMQAAVPTYPQGQNLNYQVVQGYPQVHGYSQPSQGIPKY